MSTSLETGDRVRYSPDFLRSCSIYTGEIPFARGRVTGFMHLSNDCILARIKWDTPDVPDKVNVANLEKIR